MKNLPAGGTSWSRPETTETKIYLRKGEKGESHVFNLSEECFRLRVASAKALGQEHTWYI